MENNFNLDQRQQQQQYLSQFQYLKEQRDVFENQLELVQTSLSNIINTKNTIENMKTIDLDEEILVPLGGMINIKAQIKDIEKVLVYISRDVVIEKTLDDTIQFLEKLISQHEEQIKFLSERIQQVDISLQNISQNLQRILQQQ
ncbi:MAG: prefoldin subunit alpha [Promethearchaeota archaeon]